MKQITLSTSVLIWAITQSHAFSWTKIRQDESLAQARSSPIRDDVWSSGELAVILNADQLESYSRKSDCFQRAAASIRVRCGELDLNEDERINAAISMTVCELATAKHSPPLECSNFCAENDAQVATSSPPSHSRSICVEALSRSAQYWSSYSGYLREVPQLCHAYRRWNDIDTAKDVYRNATMEAVAILRLVRRFEERERGMQKQAGDIVVGMHQALDDMDATKDALGRVSQVMQHEMQAIIEKAIYTLQDIVLTTEKRRELDREHVILQMESAISIVAEHHERSLVSLVSSLEDSIETQLQNIWSHVQAQHDGIEKLSHAINQKWITIGGEFDVMNQSILHLTSSASDAASQLRGHTDLASLAQQTQKDATRSASRLALAMADLTDGAREQIKKINDTAFAVRDELLAANQAHVSYFSWSPIWGDWGKHGLLWLLEIVLRVDPVSLEPFMQLPVFRGLTFGSQLLWYLLRTGFSSVTSILVLIMSCNRWIPALRRPIMSHSDEHQVGSSPTPRYRMWRPPRVNTCAPSSSQGLGRFRSQSRVSRIPDRLCGSTTEPC